MNFLLSNQLLRVLVGVAVEEEERVEEMVDLEAGDTRGVRAAFVVVVCEEERLDDVAVVLLREESVSSEIERQREAERAPRRDSRYGVGRFDAGGGS